MYLNRIVKQTISEMFRILTAYLRIFVLNKGQGCRKGQKSGGAGSNAARRRCPAAPSDLPKPGGAAAPPDFGRSEVAAGQRRRPALLPAPPDF